MGGLGGFATQTALASVILLAILPRIDDFRRVFVRVKEFVGVVSVEEGNPHVIAINLSRNESNRRSLPRNKEADPPANHQKQHRNRNDLRNVGVPVLCAGEWDGGGDEESEHNATSNPPRLRRFPALVANWNF